jgi:UDP-N-acetylglucosamine acyltransferase
MIHPQAIVDRRAQLAHSVEVGAFSIVGPNVVIGAGTAIGPHVTIEGHTTIGQNNRIYQFCSIGKAPQDKKYNNEPTQLTIGDDNTVHEFCSIHIGTVQDQGLTRVGNDNWIMAYTHIAHDCRIGSHTILANSAQLAGHVHIGDWAILGGITGVHQFVRVGAHAMTGGGTILFQDLPPYVIAQGNPATPHGVNAEGLKRRGFSTEAISALRKAYKTLYRSGLSLADARQSIEADAVEVIELKPLAEFLAAASRGILRP